MNANEENEVWQPEPCASVTFRNSPLGPNALWCDTHDRPWEDCVAALHEALTRVQEDARALCVAVRSQAGVTFVGIIDGSPIAEATKRLEATISGVQITPARTDHCDACNQHRDDPGRKARGGALDLELLLRTHHTLAASLEAKSKRWERTAVDTQKLLDMALKGRSNLVEQIERMRTPLEELADIVRTDLSGENPEAPDWKEGNMTWVGIRRKWLARAEAALPKKEKP